MIPDWEADQWIVCLVVVGVLVVFGWIIYDHATHTYTRDGVSMRVIAGCEYISTGDISHETLTHKANCTNHIHSWNQ